MSLMGDSVTPEKLLAVPNLSAAALYYNGFYAADVQAWKKRFPRVWWIDVLADAPANCSILDIETGDATPGDIPRWTQARHKLFPDSLLRLYCNLSTWPAVKLVVRTLPADIKPLVRYWIANPTSLPHLVPGSAATQYLWTANYDLSEFSSAWTTT